MVIRLNVIALLLLLSACSLAPGGTVTEEARLESEAATYTTAVEKRVLPEISPNPSWDEVLRRAFLANGELESAYHEWAAAVRKIHQDAAWPNANVEIGFDYMFSGESMKSWNRSTLSAGFFNDSLTLPIKARQSGKVALANAKAAGERFYVKKFEIQRKVLEAWIEYALAAERERIQNANIELLGLIVDSAKARVFSGGMQQDLLKAGIELDRAQDELKNVQLELHHMKTMLNTMLGRQPESALKPPLRIPGPRPIPADDSQIIGEAVANNPELAGLAQEIQGRKDAVELARLMYLPDISPTAAITGDVSQAVGAMIMLPTNVVAIKSEISRMRSMLAASEAMLRQTKLDRSGQFVAALYTLRNYERQAALFRDRILPASEGVVDLTRQSYATGGAGLVELIESQRMLLDAKLVYAEARAGREKKLAELESLAGVDIEVLAAKESVETVHPVHH